MLEVIVFLFALGIDQLLKFWSITVLSTMSNGFISVVPGFFGLFYAENHADNVSFLRGRSAVMTIVRILQILVVLYLLIKKREKLRPITRIALVLFAAGLIGNQLNYIIMNFVPDMFVLSFLPMYIFNAADVFVLVAMIILFIRLAFFEGQDLAAWIISKCSRDKHKANSTLKEDEKDEHNDD